MAEGFNRLEEVRKIMQWVRKNEEMQRDRSAKKLAEDLGMAPSTVSKLIKETYSECFVVEPYKNVILTGKWPNNIVFDWETLKPLETPEVEKRFRSAGQSETAAIPEIDWSVADEYLAYMNTMILATEMVSLEDMIDGVPDEQYKILSQGFTALSILLQRRGPRPQPGFFHKITQLHYTEGAVKTPILDKLLPEMPEVIDDRPYYKNVPLVPDHRTDLTEKEYLNYAKLGRDGQEEYKKEQLRLGIFVDNRVAAKPQQALVSELSFINDYSTYQQDSDLRTKYVDDFVLTDSGEEPLMPNQSTTREIEIEEWNGE